MWPTWMNLNLINCSLPKSVHKERMISNQNIFNFELTDEDMRKISLLPNLGGQCADPDEVDF